MSRFDSTAGPRLLSWLFGISFSVIVAAILANAAMLLFAVPEIISASHSFLGSWFGEFAERARSDYPLLQISNIILCCFGLFIVFMLRRAAIMSQPRNMVSVDNSLRIATIAVALLAMEVVGSLARFYIFDDRLSYIKLANYAGIGCVFILAYVLFRAAKNRDEENTTV